MSILYVADEGAILIQELTSIGAALIKTGADALPSYALSGMLQMWPSGYLVLSVPNAVVRGLFLAMDETGIELPKGPNDEPFNAHITVMTPEEVAMAGGEDKITERGKRFAYRIGGLVEMEPHNWPGIAKIWLLRIHSSELQTLRRSYGLSSLPRDGALDFHVTVAVRKRGVLGRNETAKG